jgi:hypothetical protein
MHVGMSTFFQNRTGTHTDGDVYGHELSMADLAEPLGFDGVWAPEHHFDQYTMGEFNWSSQHLAMEVLYGTTAWVDGDVDGAAGDAVAGPTAGAARGGAGVLGEDRRGAVERGGGDRVWRVRLGRGSLVPRAGRHAVDRADGSLGQVPVVR